VLWGTLNQFNNTGLTMQDKRILFRTRECLPALFEGFNDNCVLIHGNFTLRSMLKDSRSDQLLAMVGPGIMLWAPREYELFRLSDSGAAEGLLWHYLQRAPVAKRFSGGAGSTCSGTKSRSWLIPDALIAQTSIWRQNHSCPGSPEPFSHCQRRPSVS
jgi:hypothetical protein